MKISKMEYEALIADAVEAETRRKILRIELNAIHKVYGDKEYSDTISVTRVAEILNIRLDEFKPVKDEGYME